MNSPATPPPDSTLGADIEQMLIRMYSDSGLMIGGEAVEVIKSARAALLARFEAFGKELLDNIEASVSQHTVPDGKGLVTRSYVLYTLEFERTRLAHLLQGKGE